MKPKDADRNELYKYLKKEGLDINKSEPEVLIEAMNKHENWCFNL